MMPQNPDLGSNAFFVPRKRTIQQKIACKTYIQIVNLSSRKLTQNEIKLLERGLKFTPTPTKQELNEDRVEFTRKVRLVEYFEGNEDENDQTLVRKKSNWIPPKGRDSDLEAFVTNVTDIPLTPNDKSKIKHNLPKSQQNSIKSLTDDESSIIKEADKGGATVIMNKSFYQRKIEDMLSNQEFYEQLDNNPHEPIMATYKKNSYINMRQTFPKRNLNI